MSLAVLGMKESMSFCKRHRNEYFTVSFSSRFVFVVDDHLNETLARLRFRVWNMLKCRFCKTCATYSNDSSASLRNSNYISLHCSCSFFVCLFVCFVIFVVFLFFSTDWNPSYSVVP